MREDTWQAVQVDPEVVAARQALEALEREENRLTRELGRAVLRAIRRAEGAQP